MSLGLDRNMNEVSHLKPPRRDYRSAQRVFSRTTVLLSAGRRVLLGVVVVVCWWGGAEAGSPSPGHRVRLSIGLQRGD